MINSICVDHLRTFRQQYCSVTTPVCRSRLSVGAEAHASADANQPDGVSPLCRTDTCIPLGAAFWRTVWICAVPVIPFGLS